MVSHALKYVLFSVQRNLIIQNVQIFFAYRPCIKLRNTGMKIALMIAKKLLV